MIATISSIVLTLLSAYISFREKLVQSNKPEDIQKNRRTKATLWIAIIGAVFTLYAGIDGCVQKKKKTELAEQKEKAAQAASDSIRRLNQQIHTLALEQLDTSKTIVRLSQELIASYKENAILEKELRKYFTGGDMIPWLTILPGIDRITFLMLNAGQYPMWNVKVKCNEQQLPDIGTLPPGLNNRFYTQMMNPAHGKEEFHFVIWYDNGKSVQASVYVKKEAGELTWQLVKVDYADHNDTPFKHPMLIKRPSFMNKYRQNVYNPDFVY